MKPGLKKQIPKIIFFLLITAVMLVIIIKTNDLREIWSVLKVVDAKWLSISLLILIIYILVNPLSLFVLSRSKDCKITLTDSIMIASTEYFFNGITPFATGGQPFLVYAFNKAHVKPSKSTGILLMNFVSYQIAVVILCFLSLIFYDQIKTEVPGLQVLVIVGFVMNILVLLMFLSVGISSKVRNVLSKFINWILNFKIFKGKLHKASTKFEGYCIDAQIAFKSLISQKLRFTFAIIFKLISLIIFYSIPFFLLKSIGVDLNLTKLPFIISMTTFAVAMTCFIPTPGSSGGIEFAFKTLFATIAGVTSSVAVSGMLMWRLLTYYILMIFSFMVYLCIDKYFKNVGYDIEENIEEIETIEEEKTES